MIAIHHKINQLSDDEALMLLAKMGTSAAKIKPTFQNLPRFPIDLSNAPFNMDVVRLMLHALASTPSPFQNEMRFFFFFNNVASLKNDAAFRKNWSYYAHKILLAINNDISISYKNERWKIKPSNSLLNIEDIQELIESIEQKTRPISPNAYKQLTKETAPFSFQKIKKNISSGRINKALDLLLSSKDDFNRELSDKILALSSRFKNVEKDKIDGVLSSEETTREQNKITKSLLGLIQLLEGEQ